MFEAHPQVKRRKRAFAAQTATGNAEVEAEAVAPTGAEVRTTGSSAAREAEGEDDHVEAGLVSFRRVKKNKKKKTSRSAAQTVTAIAEVEASAKVEAEAPAEVERETFAERLRSAAPEAEEEVHPAKVKDRKGVLHFASIPLCMRHEKLRHMMEQFGEVGRVYLAPEDKDQHRRRKKAGGNRRVRFIEGWVEFADKGIAKRVAMSLNGTTIGGRKRHNYFRDDVWNIQYLSKFKWHQLKEGEIYNRQVRKARLEQKITQATRENEFYLERIEQARNRKKADERRASKGHIPPKVGGDGGRFGNAKSPAAAGGGAGGHKGNRVGGSGGAEISKHVIDCLF